MKTLATILTELTVHIEVFKECLSSIPASAAWPRALAPPPWSCYWNLKDLRKSCGPDLASLSPAWTAANAPALDAGPLSATYKRKDRWTVLYNVNAVFCRHVCWHDCSERGIGREKQSTLCLYAWLHSNPPTSCMASFSFWNWCLFCFSLSIIFL